MIRPFRQPLPSTLTTLCWRVAAATVIALFMMTEWGRLSLALFFAGFFWWLMMRGKAGNSTRFQFSLPMLFCAVILVTPPITLARYMAQRQHRAVEAIQAMGGQVHFRRGVAIGVVFSGPGVTDDSLGEIKPHLIRLPRLKLLILEKTVITDVAVVHLKELKQLKLLDVYNSRISWHAMDELKRALPTTNVCDPRLSLALGRRFTIMYGEAARTAGESAAR